ncbi:DUF3363 domain-containing protein (plasmid) [Ralstonia pseudosolanacearum]|uniref:DUF3363 domain-containing protein n=1 Tax=Ralstonia solanacearum TaxID=305 RepID=A0AA92K7J6_RALSL|nr:DUF3363 domain-containing protein [Ralstonia pseudosolanacearum]QOK99744.1 DUF3363 domain-containing protein [Ralstonia pseudosolanacearum]
MARPAVDRRRQGDGIGFSLGPCKPVIEQRLGQQLAATVRGGGVPWEVTRSRQLALG